MSDLGTRFRPVHVRGHRCVSEREAARRSTRLLPGLAVAFFLLALAVPSPAGAASRESPFPPGEYVGAETCAACHDASVATFAHTTHAKVLNETNGRTELARRGCEACHGPGKAHVDAGGGKGIGDLVTFRRESPETARREQAVCLTCHEKGRRVHWAGSVHDQPDVGCTSCHTLMQKVSGQALLAKPAVTDLCGTCHIVKRAQTFRNAHMPVREGKMTCTSCHNPHGTVTKALLPTDSPNDTCYSCHANKRGPFLWEHPPVSENCMNCHDPHGSVRERMLRLSLPRLCQACHVETLHPTEARLPTNKFVIGRACAQCHVNLHGSNHPSGFAFTR